MKTMTRIICLSLGAFACLTGCTLAPDYNRPQAPIPADWPGGAAYPKTGATTNPSDVMQLTRRDFFSNQKLLQVVEMALQNNRDLRLAALNVEQARALYNLQRAELLPVFNATGNASRQRVPPDISGTGQATTYNQFGTNLGISAWEIDFFGRIRSLADRQEEPGELGGHGFLGAWCVQGFRSNQEVKIGRITGECVG